MFKNRSNQQELMDDFNLNQPALLKNLNEIEMTNRWFGSKTTLLSAIKNISKLHKQKFTTGICVADIGCGNGDLLRAISTWAQKEKYRLKLSGIDANPFMIKVASEKSSRFSNISFQETNVFEEAFKEIHYDVITLNSFCHHFSNEELIRLLQQLTQQTEIAIIINDLHRHWLPYFFIKIVSRLFSFSYLARYDGPVSVLRAFTKKDLVNIMTASSCAHYKITWRLAFRWQVIIHCNRQKGYT